MLNEQVMGLLQNNAGNPAIVKRIAEENQLSQTEIAQALKIPEEAAARYMPAMGEAMDEPIEKPGMTAPAAGANAAAVGAANAASQALVAPAGFSAGSAGPSGSDIMRGGMGAPAAGQGLAGGMATGTLSNPPGMAAPPPATGSAPAVAPAAASPMGQMADTMQKPMAVEPPPQAMQKPAKLPAEMKPQGMGEAVGLREPMGRRPGGNPSLPRLPAFGRGRSSTATDGESAFVDAFNRLRGNIQ